MSINKKEKRRSSEEEWLSISDLMSGLMVMFLFVAISLILNAKGIAEKAQSNREQIHAALSGELEEDLRKWGAVIDEQGLVTFNDPNTLFKTGSAELSDDYKKILAQFFPRYMQAIEKHKDKIIEIRIEGHTSSEWNTGATGDWAYFENMRLSQDRTRAVLNYVYSLPEIAPNREWVKENLAAVGLSSAKVIKNAKGIEDKQASKRVTFRIITNDQAVLEEIGKELGQEMRETK